MRWGDFEDGFHAGPDTAASKTTRNDASVGPSLRAKRGNPSSFFIYALQKAWIAASKTPRNDALAGPSLRAERGNPCLFLLLHQFKMKIGFSSVKGTFDVACTLRTD